MDILKYKGYDGIAGLNAVRGLWHGRLLFIDDLVTFEAFVATDLQREFEAAVDDYIETCRNLGREPQKPHVNGDRAISASF